MQDRVSGLENGNARVDGKARKKAGLGLGGPARRQGSDEEVQEDSTGKLMKRLRTVWSGQARCRGGLGK